MNTSCLPFVDESNLFAFSDSSLCLNVTGKDLVFPVYLR